MGATADARGRSAIPAVTPALQAAAGALAIGGIRDTPVSSSDRRLLRLPLRRLCVDVCDRHPKGRGQDTSAECGACTPANGSRQDIEVLIVHAKIAFSLGEALGQMTDMLHSSDAIKQLSITWAGMGRLGAPTDRSDGAALASGRAHRIVCGRAAPMRAPLIRGVLRAAQAEAARAAAPTESEGVRDVRDNAATAGCPQAIRPIGTMRCAHKRSSLLKNAVAK